MTCSDFRPPEETESTTIGGLVTEWLGHVPHVGESIERDGIRIEVLAGDELKRRAGARLQGGAEDRADRRTRS